MTTVEEHGFALTADAPLTRAEAAMALYRASCLAQPAEGEI